MSLHVETHAVLLTSPGRGAVATVLVDGPHAVATLEQLFDSIQGRPLADYALAQIAFGRWRPTGEEVVVCRRAMNRIEIHCHGGSAAAQALLASLADHGCQVIDAVDWLRHSRSDPLAADAIEALGRARTVRTAAVLLDQKDGALRRELTAIVTDVRSGDRQGAAARLQALQARSAVGKHLAVPFRVVLAGSPNVGKSTLTNALVGYRRSIESDQPGTTRDVVTATTAIDGWPVELADTAGLRETPEDGVETQGACRAREQVIRADLVLLVFDANVPWSSADDALRCLAAAPLVVHNKCDLVDEMSAVRPPGIYVSARTGAGLPALIDAIARRLVPEPPPPGAGVPFLPEHHDAIARAQLLLAAGQLDEVCASIENLSK